MFGSFQAHQEAFQRALEIFNTVDAVSTEHYSSEKFKGEPLTAYEVHLDGVVLGRVVQHVQHVYKVHNRVRYGDRYLLRWQYDWPKMEADCRSGYYDTRKKAVVELLLVAIRKGKIK